MELDELLSEKEVAAKLHVSISFLKIRRLHGEGGPPFIKIGRTVRYPAGDVAAWIKAKYPTGVIKVAKKEQVTKEVGIDGMFPKVVEQYILNEKGISELNPEYYSSGMHLVS